MSIQPIRIGKEGNDFVIRIEFDVLKHAARFCPHFYDGFKNPSNCGPYVDIVDDEEFIRDIRSALNHEQEDGSTPLTDMLDDAIKYAYEDGGLSFSTLPPVVN